MNTIHRKYYSGEQVFDIISKCKGRTFIELLNKFAEAPSADVVEVKHGEWIYTKEILARGGHVSVGECSVCKKRIMPYSEPNYCPNCGADMRERREDA